MKKHYYLYTLLLALLVGMATACEDRLNIEKHGNMGSVDDYYQTDDNCNLAWRTDKLDMSTEMQNTYAMGTYGFMSKHKLLPIPLTEIEVNPNMVQNEGW